jgi:cytochrome b6-f complex iron-sulfur subunit
MSSTRRRFLCHAAGTLAISRLGAGCGEPPGPRDAGNVEDLAVGDLVAVEGEAILVGRDDAGVYAMTAICTHLGCNIAKSGTVTSSGVECGCHGSTFDEDGAVTGGPAKDDLEHYAVEIAEDGQITVDTATVVDAGERAEV